MNKEDSIRTPLARARGLGSAKEGSAHWWVQRVTSVLLIPLSLYLLFNVRYFLPEPEAYIGLVAILSDPLMTIALILSVLIGFYHAYLGVQVIVEDYVHQPGPKTACLLGNVILFLFLGAVCLYAIAYISFAIPAAGVAP